MVKLRWRVFAWSMWLESSEFNFAYRFRFFTVCRFLHSSVHSRHTALYAIPVDHLSNCVRIVQKTTPSTNGARKRTKPVHAPKIKKPTILPRHMEDRTVWESEKLDGRHNKSNFGSFQYTGSWSTGKMGLAFFLAPILHRTSFCFRFWLRPTVLSQL